MPPLIISKWTTSPLEEALFGYTGCFPVPGVVELVLGRLQAPVQYFHGYPSMPHRFGPVDQRLQIGLECRVNHSLAVTIEDPKSEVEVQKAID